MRIAAAALMLGLTAGAGAQQSANEPPPSFMVFFDWGKGEVRSDDAATLDKVAETYRATPSARLKLSGHSDRSGSAATNRRTAVAVLPLPAHAITFRGTSPASRMASGPAPRPER